MAIAHTPAKPWLSMDEATHAPRRTCSHLVRARAPAEATPTRRGRKRAGVNVQPAGSGSAPSGARCCEASAVPAVRANDSRLPTSERGQWLPGAGGPRWPRGFGGGLALQPREVVQASIAPLRSLPAHPGAHSQGPAHSLRPLALRSLARLTGPPCGPSGVSAVRTEP